MTILRIPLNIFTQCHTKSIVTWCIALLSATARSITQTKNLNSKRIEPAHVHKAIDNNEFHIKDNASLDNSIIY